MFLRRYEPILLHEEGLEGLCASLNRPVVHVEGMPVAPATAVIALHRDAHAQRGLVVALRSEESGVVLLFEFRDEPRSTPARAIDDGLAFAEGMGFLFDEDLLGSGDPSGRQRAFQCWCDIVGEELPSESPSVPSSPDLLDGPGFDDPEHSIDQLDDFDDLGPLDELGPLIEAVPESEVLSKFRRTPEATLAPTESATAPNRAVAASESAAPAQLGRIPIVRKKKSQQEAAPAPLLTRLLAKF